MTIRRVYQMVALPDRTGDLFQALRTLAERLSPLDGNAGVEILADVDNVRTYTFVEHWESVEHQKAAGALLGRDAFAGIGPTLAAPPISTNQTLVFSTWKQGSG